MDKQLPDGVRLNGIFSKMEASLWLNKKSQVLLKVGHLPYAAYAAGKQPSIPLINLGINGR